MQLRGLACCLCRPTLAHGRGLCPVIPGTPRRHGLSKCPVPTGATATECKCHCQVCRRSGSEANSFFSPPLAFSPPEPGSPPLLGVGGNLEVPQCPAWEEREDGPEPESLWWGWGKRGVPDRATGQTEVQ